MVPDWWVPFQRVGTFPTVATGPRVQPRDVNSLQRLYGQPSWTEASTPQLRGPGGPGLLFRPLLRGWGNQGQVQLFSEAPGALSSWIESRGSRWHRGHPVCHSYLPVRSLCSGVVSAMRCQGGRVDVCERGGPVGRSVPGTQASSPESGNLRMGTRGKRFCGVGTGRRASRCSANAGELGLLHKPSSKAPISRERAS